MDHDDTTLSSFSQKFEKIHIRKKMKRVINIGGYIYTKQTSYLYVCVCVYDSSVE